MHAITYYHVYARSADLVHTKARSIIDSLVTSQSSLIPELSLYLHTSLLEMKQSLSLVSIEMSRSKEGRGGQEHLNKAFSTKSTQ
jgi:hypothetical protein